MILFPQLPHHIALQIADGARSAPVDVLAGMAAPEHPSCEYTPIGNRSTRTALIKLRNDLLQIAMDAGYPQPPGGQSAADFDARASIVLIQQMPMVPAEAARGRMGVPRLCPVAGYCPMALQRRRWNDYAA